MSTHGVSTMNKHQEYYFRDGNICFLVENTEFRLHRHFFERESEYFRSRLNPQPDGEDGSLDRPYIIHDVKSDDFAQFVWVWYNPQYSFSKQGKERWLTILRLATMWRFTEIRNLAIRHLEKVKFEPIDKITTYRKYSVDDELLLPSYVSLCRSPTLPSPQEGNILTLDTVLKIATAREQLLLRASERGYKTPTTASVPDDVANALVADLFELTLHPNDHSVRMEGQGQTMTNGNAFGADSGDPEVVTVKQPNPGKKGTQIVPPQNGASGSATKGPVRR